MTTPRDSLIRPGLLLVAFGALAGSMLELIIRFASHRWLPWPRAALYFNPQAAWLGPLANVLLLALPVLLVLAFSRRLGRERSLRIIAFGCFTYAAFGPLLLMPRIHNAALLVLAAGIGANAARWVFAESRRWKALGRATAVLAALCAALTIGWNGWLSLTERRARAALPAPSSGRSILLVIFDTVRSSNLGSYGHRRPTSPVVDSLARAGVRFSTALSSAPWTLPSHVTMLTGRWQHEQSTSWTHGREGLYPTIAQLLATRGYASGGFSANTEYVSRHFGMHLGFGTFRDHIVSPWAMIDASAVTRFARGRLPQRLILRIPGRKTAAVVNREFLDWQEDLGGRPFFAMLNYYDAHAPYAPPAPFDMQFLTQEPPSRDAWPGPPFPPAVIEGLEAAYDGGIAYADHELGNLLRELDQRGVLDSAIVIMTSDHGEEFGEHGMIGHGHGLHYPAVHVPLIMTAPGMPAGVVVEQPVSLLDVPATAMDLATRAPAPVPGHTLASLWQGDTAAPRSPALSEVRWQKHVPGDAPLAHGDMASIVAGRFHLIRRGDGVVALYDRINDPSERNDLADDPRFQAQRDSLSAALSAAESLGTRRAIRR